SIFPDFSCRKTTTNLLHYPFHMVGMMHFLPSPPLHVLQVGSGIVVPALIVPKNPAGLVRHPGKLGDIIGKRAKAFFALFHMFASHNNLGDLISIDKDTINVS